MIFKGFQQKFPEYEIITPQTNQTFTIRSITTSEELKIKTSLVSNSTFTLILNEMLYESLIKKPKNINNFEDFCNNMTLNDRDALFIGWYHCSYGNVIEQISHQCTNCDHKFTINYDLSTGGNLVSYPDKQNILDKEVKVDLKYVDATVYLKVPTLKKEIDYSKNTFLQAQNEDILGYLMMIDRIEYYEESDKQKQNPIQIPNMTDMVIALNSIIPKDRKLITKEYSENFGKYSLTLPFITNCPNCKEQLAGEVSLIQYFFREIYSG